MTCAIGKTMIMLSQSGSDVVVHILLTITRQKIREVCEVMAMIIMIILCVITIICMAIILFYRTNELKNAKAQSNRHRENAEQLEEVNKLLRIISDESYIPDFGKKIFYHFLITERIQDCHLVQKVASEYGMSSVSTLYGRVVVTLLYTAESSVMERFRLILPGLLEDSPAYVATSVSDQQNMNRMFRQAKTEYVTARFKQETPRAILGDDRHDRQDPLSVEPKELERKLFLKLINGDFAAGIETLETILAMDHSDYRDLPMLKSKLFCILENAAYLLAFKSGSEDILSDKAPRLWGTFESAATADVLVTVGTEFILMMQEHFSTASSSVDKLLADIELYMKNNYSNCEVSISGISAEFNVLPQQLSRDFKAKYKISPSDYLQQLRLTRAKELLLNTAYSNETVAELAGFGSAKALYRAMNKVDNTTPNQYRRSAGALSDEE